MTKNTHWFLLVLLLLGLHGFSGNVVAQTTSPPTVPKTLPLAGKWSYRSFRSDPDLNVEPNELLFGRATIEFAAPQGETLSGTLGGEGWQLKLTGTLKAGDPQVVRFQGRGTVGGEEWVYDYIGYVVPAWPNGVDQRPAIVGSVVRTVPHSNGQGGTSPAGVVAQWLAVQQGDFVPRAIMRSPETSRDRKKLFELYKQQELGNGQRPANETPVQNPSSEQPSPGLLRNNRVAVADDAVSVPPAPQEVVIKSQNGRLDAELVVAYNDLQAPNPLRIGNDAVHLRTYNGRLVGPTLRAKAGDTLYITLRNNLPAEPGQPGDGHAINGHHEWNTTNIHFHGLHVAPQGTPDAESDNVLLSVPPGSVQKYEVHIPSDHVAGTFWYHAHRHGSTAAQVSSGMAGALIIERDDDQHNLDSIPAVAAAKQDVMVLQAIPYLKDRHSTEPGSIELSPDGSGANEQAMFLPNKWRGLRRYITVNGERIPTITVAPGEVRRLRLIATGQREKVLMGLEKAGSPSTRLALHEIAVDGLPTGGIRAANELELFPGYRSDVLVQFPADASGDYYLVDGNAADGTGKDGSPEPLRWVARFHVVGAVVQMALPTAAVLAPQGLAALREQDATDTRYAFYGITSQGFFISREFVPVNAIPIGSEFDPTSIRTLLLGKTERWQVGSRNDGLNVTHPFHIHINPFLVTRVLDSSNQDVTVAEFGGPVWRDTLAMKQGYTYTLLTKYVRFTGDFVSHCHILDHEDTGMMEYIRITDSIVAAPEVRKGFIAAPLVERHSLPDLGVAAPDFVLPDANGQMHALSQFRGKPSVLFFFKGSGCLHCLRQITAFIAHYSTFRENGIQVVGVTSDDVDTLKSALAAVPCPFTLLADPQGFAFAKYGCSTIDGLQHGTFALGAGGEIKWRNAGPSPYLDIANLVKELSPSAPVGNGVAASAPRPINVPLSSN